ncbi:MAG: pyruvate kinase [Eubacteriales bacterium]|nr:pyruvate kinase [Eubacteriales bacterium]
MDIYGTLGPACQDPGILEDMFRQGMTGIRLNLSHTTLPQAAELIDNYHSAAAAQGIHGKLLIDLQGPELRMGNMAEPFFVEENRIYEDLPLPPIVAENLEKGDILLIDDGKILAEAVEGSTLRIVRGGLLKGGKSIAVQGKTVSGPAVTEKDRENLRAAKAYGVTGVMQPFVRSSEDLRELKMAMEEAGCPDIRMFAKIENMEGVRKLESFFSFADEIVIARGDLGNAVPLWDLPVVQQKLSAACRRAGKPFMVVTQMLASMEHCAVPTRAEVNDIFHAVKDGAASVMVTGETAVGEYPAEVIRYLANTVREAEKYCRSCEKAAVHAGGERL